LNLVKESGKQTELSASESYYI